MVAYRMGVVNSSSCTLKCLFSFYWDRESAHQQKQKETFCGHDSRLDMSCGPTGPLAVLAPGDDPPTKHVASTVQRLRDRLLRAGLHARGVLGRQLHAPRELPARKSARRIAEEHGVVHARPARRQCQGERRELDPCGRVLVVRVRRLLLLLLLLCRGRCACGGGGGGGQSGQAA